MNDATRTLLTAFYECREAVSTGMYPELFDIARDLLAAETKQARAVTGADFQDGRLPDPFDVSES